MQKAEKQEAKTEKWEERADAKAAVGEDPKKERDKEKKHHGKMVDEKRAADKEKEKLDDKVHDKPHEHHTIPVIGKILPHKDKSHDKHSHSGERHDGVHAHVVRTEETHIHPGANREFAGGVSGQFAAPAGNQGWDNRGHPLHAGEGLNGQHGTLGDGLHGTGRIPAPVFVPATRPVVVETTTVKPVVVAKPVIVETTTVKPTTLETKTHPVIVEHGTAGKAFKAAEHEGKAEVEEAKAEKWEERADEKRIFGEGTKKERDKEKKHYNKAVDEKHKADKELIDH